MIASQLPLKQSRRMLVIWFRGSVEERELSVLSLLPPARQFLSCQPVEQLPRQVSAQRLCPTWQICDSFLPLFTSCWYIRCGHLFFFSVISYTFKLDKGGIFFKVYGGGGVLLFLEQDFFTQLVGLYNTFNNTTHPIKLLVSVDICQLIKNKYMILQSFCCKLENQSSKA